METKKIKLFLLRLYNGICIPAIIVHELLHFLFIKLTFAKYLMTRVVLDENYKETGSLSVAVFYDPKNTFQIIIINIAPALALLICPILFYFDLQILAKTSLIYTIICLRVVLPSKEDLKIIKNRKKYILSTYLKENF